MYVGWFAHHFSRFLHHQHTVPPSSGASQVKLSLDGDGSSCSSSTAAGATGKVQTWSEVVESGELGRKQMEIVIEHL